MYFLLKANENSTPAGRMKNAQPCTVMQAK